MKKRLLGWFGNKFLQDTATLQVAGMINQVSQLASAVALAFLLGAHGQGLFITAITLQALVYFLINVGVAPATASQISACAARHNEVKAAAWIAFMAKATLALGVTVFIVGYFVFPWVGARFYGEREIGIWAWWLCAQPILEMPRFAAQVAFQGTRRMLFLAQLENGYEMVRFFLVIVGALLTGSPAGAILGMLGASVFGSVLAVALFLQARHDGAFPLPGLGEILRHMRDIKIRQGLRLGLRVAVVKNSHVVFCTILPRLVIGSFAGQSWVTYFHIADRIMGVPMMFARGVSRTMLPALGELAGLKDAVAFRRLFTKVTLVTGGLVSTAILVALPLIPYLVAWLFPSDYTDPVFHYSWILALGYMPFAFAVGLESFYIAANQVRAWLWISLVGALLLIPSFFWLAGNIPETGAAWGLSLYMSWILVHLAYIASFFSRTRHQEHLWIPRDGSGSGDC